MRLPVQECWCAPADDQAGQEDRHPIDRAHSATSHGRDIADEAGGTKASCRDEQKKEDSRINDGAEDFALECVKFLNSSAKFTASREAVGMNAKRTREMKTSDREAIHYTEEQVEQELKDFGGRAPEMSTLPLEYPFRQCYQFRAQPDGKLYYRRYACACDPCMDSPTNGWDTSQCEYTK